MADGDQDAPGDAGTPVASRHAADLDVEFAALGGPDGGPALDLDHERFAYAGKFVVTSTGKAVAREVDPTDGPADSRAPGDGEVLAATAFDLDRTDPSVVRIRYVTVRRDRRGDGLGARLLENVYPACEALAVLRERGPSTADEAFEALRDRIPRWERSRHADWAAEWRERIANLLGWCVALDLAHQEGDAYRAVPSKD